MTGEYVLACSMFATMFIHVMNHVCNVSQDDDSLKKKTIRNGTLSSVVCRAVLSGIWLLK